MAQGSAWAARTRVAASQDLPLRVAAGLTGDEETPSPLIIGMKDQSDLVADHVSYADFEVASPVRRTKSGTISYADLQDVCDSEVSSPECEESKASQSKCTSSWGKANLEMMTRPGTLRPSHGTSARGSNTLDYKFTLCAEWQDDDETSSPMAQQRSTMRDVLAMSRQSAAIPDGTLPSFGSGIMWGDARHGNRLWRRLVLHPDRTPRICWMSLSGSIVIYEAIVIPLAAFSIPHSQFMEHLSWSFTLWWTLDIFVNLMTGYHDHGVIELRQMPIFRQYARTWFGVDVVLCFVDWLALSLDLVAESDGSSFVRSGRTLRNARVLKLIRLARSLKLVDFLKQQLQRIGNETTRGVVNMFGIICLVLLLSHYIACIWYLIGTAHEGSGWDTWTEMFVEQEHREIAYPYAVALHWSLTQMTPSTNNISPRNVHERSFAVVVVVSALVVFSSLVGSISAKITVLRQLKSRQMEEEAKLREYLSKHRVSLETGHRIWVYLRMNPNLTRAPLHESGVVLLKDIPKSLRVELRAEVYMKAACFHPIFPRLAETATSLTAGVCDQAMAERSIRPLQDVFVEGDDAHEMFFVTRGTLSYHTPLYESSRTARADGVYSCVSEAALWGPWVHCGRLFATCSSELVSLDAKLFRTVATKTHAHGQCLVVLRAYAATFLQTMQGAGGLFVEEPVTDLIKAVTAQCLVDEALGTNARARRRSSRSGFSGETLSSGLAQWFHFTSGARGDRA